MISAVVNYVEENFGNAIHKGVAFGILIANFFVKIFFLDNLKTLANQLAEISPHYRDFEAEEVVFYGDTEKRLVKAHLLKKWKPLLFTYLR